MKTSKRITDLFDEIVVRNCRTRANSVNVTLLKYEKGKFVENLNHLSPERCTKYDLTVI